MRKKCPKCESITAEYEDYVGGTLFYRCKTCKYQGSDFEPITLFNRITTNEESLAEVLIYETATFDRDGHLVFGYRSILTGGFWTKKPEAIVAIVEKLKEVEK